MYPTPKNLTHRQISDLIRAMTYMNAMQGVDGLMGGFDAALGVLRERNQERAERSNYMRLLGEYNDLVRRHNAHVSTVNNQAKLLRRAEHAAGFWEACARRQFDRAEAAEAALRGR